VSASDVRYVLRFVSKMEGTKGEVRFDGCGDGTLQGAQKFTLAEVNARLKELFEHAKYGGANAPPVREIVRVRRVAGPDKWVPMRSDEIDAIALVDEDREPHRLMDHLMDTGYGAVTVSKRAPGEQRWEVVDE
jgi:hypothetical protein